jgi:prepilin peptidase CpaA|tara:strand:- start:24181 stop:24732 length:552 start_codon:yes stop_codon:yes gene_type:complete
VLFSQPLFTAGLLTIWCLACAFYDLTQRRLPNFLTLGVHIPALAILLIAGHGLLGATAISCLLAWSAALFLTLPAYAFRWLGAGDVKFLASIGLLTGLNFLLVSYAIAGLLSGMIVVAWLSAQRVLPYLNLQLASTKIQLPVLARPTGKVLPFGAILAVSVLITLCIPAYVDFIPLKSLEGFS